MTNGDKICRLGIREWLGEELGFACMNTFFFPYIDGIRENLAEIQEEADWKDGSAAHVALPEDQDLIFSSQRVAHNHL